MTIESSSEGLVLELLRRLDASMNSSFSWLEKPTGAMPVGVIPSILLSSLISGVLASVVVTPIFFLYRLVFNGSQWFYNYNEFLNPHYTFDWTVLFWTPLFSGLGVFLVFLVLMVLYVECVFVYRFIVGCYHFLTRSRASRLWTLCSIFWCVFSFGYVSYKLLDSKLLEVARFANDINLLDADIQTKLAVLLGAIYGSAMFLPPIIGAVVYGLGVWVWRAGTGSTPPSTERPSQT